MTISRRTLAAAALALSIPSAYAQNAPIKVGIVGPFSGPFAHYGSLFKAAAEAYIAEQGGKLAGKEVELRRDNRAAVGFELGQRVWHGGVEEARLAHAAFGSGGHAGVSRRLKRRSRLRTQ